VKGKRSGGNVRAAKRVSAPRGLRKRKGRKTERREQVEERRKDLILGEASLLGEGDRMWARR